MKVEVARCRENIFGPYPKKIRKGLRGDGGEASEAARWWREHLSRCVLAEDLVDLGVLEESAVEEA